MTNIRQTNKQEIRTEKGTLCFVSVHLLECSVIGLHFWIRR